MKKIWSIILLVAVIGMASCSDDDKDEGNIEVPSEVLGEWKLEGMTIGTLQTTDANVESIARDMFKELSKEYYYGEEIEFFDNGTMEFKGETIKYTITKSSLTLIDNSGYKLNFSYVVVNSKLICTLNMRDIIINELSGELSGEEMNYLKNALKQFTIDFTYGK